MPESLLFRLIPCDIEYVVSSRLSSDVACGENGKENSCESATMNAEVQSVYSNVHASWVTFTHQRLHTPTVSCPPAG
jgi:hypothetical protein